MTSVLAGKRYVSRAISAKLAANPPAQQVSGTSLRVLSAREREILAAVTAGKSIGEIAAELGLSIKTVSTYKRRLLNKLQLNSTADLVRFVLENESL